jgi:hypothetical protein
MPRWFLLLYRSNNYKGKNYNLVADLPTLFQSSAHLCNIIFTLVYYFAHGARVVIKSATFPSGTGFAHGALVERMGMLFWPEDDGCCSRALFRNVSVGACRSDEREGVHVQGNNFEKTKCWTTTLLLRTSPWYKRRSPLATFSQDWTVCEISYSIGDDSKKGTPFFNS